MPKAEGMRDDRGWRGRDTLRKDLYFFLLLVLTTVGCNSDSGSGSSDKSDELPYDAVSLTNNIEDKNPRWSAVGNEIVFQRGGFVFVMDVASQSVSRMVQGYCPVFSSDGLAIAFIRGKELYKIFNAQSSMPQKLSMAACASEIGGLDWDAINGFAYFINPDTARKNSRLIVYNEVAESYHWFPEYNNGFGEYPRWSADGEKILFNSRDDGPVVIDAATESMTIVKPWALSGKTCWYDSTSILYATRGQLARIHLVSGKDTVLCNRGFFPGSMEYNPRIKKLVFDSNGLRMMDIP